MRKPTRTPSRADVARSLRELEILFGKRPIENDNAPRQRGAGEATELNKLHRYDTTKLGGEA